MRKTLDVGVEVSGLAIAIQKLLVGLAQPFVGALADRHGAGRVSFWGAFVYVAGLILAAWTGSSLGLHLSFGLLLGVALAAPTFVIVLGALGRVVSAARRTLAFGIVTAGGSPGPFLVVTGSTTLCGAVGS